jgi:hypothetical protein
MPPNKQSPNSSEPEYALAMRRSPQEEKALSYARDRRYAYGNNSKAARKAVPRRKRAVNKINRHASQQILAQARGPADADYAAKIEQRLLGQRPKTWRKVPDMPLGQVLRLKRMRAHD